MMTREKYGRKKFSHSNTNCTINLQWFKKVSHFTSGFQEKATENKGKGNGMVNLCQMTEEINILSFLSKKSATLLKG